MFRSVTAGWATALSAGRVPAGLVAAATNSDGCYWGGYPSRSFKVAHHNAHRELGRALKLDDNSDALKMLLIKHDRNRNLVDSLTAYGKDNVKACY